MTIVLSAEVGPAGWVVLAVCFAALVALVAWTLWNTALSVFDVLGDKVHTGKFFYREHSAQSRFTSPQVDALAGWIVIAILAALFGLLSLFVV